MTGIAELVKSNAFIHGGGFRLDKGPTKAETEAFRLAMVLHEECRRAGKQTIPGMILNDLGIWPPEERPKMTGKLEFPSDYVSILLSCGFASNGSLRFLEKNAQGLVVWASDRRIKIFYETTLRNAARKNKLVNRERNEHNVPIVHCPSIMGRFYEVLFRSKFTQQIGFYPFESGCADDHACPRGPMRGVIPELSGYPNRLEVINYWVSPEGAIMPGCRVEPGQ